MQPQGQRDDGPFDHPALFYRSPADYLDGTVPFIRDGLAAGDPVAVSVPGPNLRLLREALGPDARRVRLLDMTEVGRNPGRILADVLHASADAYPDHHVRIIGEPIWPSRTDVEYPACLQHEALINWSFRGRRVTILCPYDATHLDPTVLDDAAQTHPVLVVDGERLPSGRYDPALAVARASGPLPLVDARSVAFDATRLRSARRLARDTARRVGLSGDRLDDFVLAIGELAANSVEHGGGSGRLRLWTEDGVLVGEVSDPGWLRDPLAGRRHAGPGRLGGRGLPMVNSVADLVRTVTGAGGTTTRVYMRLRDHLAPEPPGPLPA